MSSHDLHSFEPEENSGHDVTVRKLQRRAAKKVAGQNQRRFATAIRIPSHQTDLRLRIAKLHLLWTSFRIFNDAHDPRNRNLPLLEHARNTGCFLGWQFQSIHDGHFGVVGVRSDVGCIRLHQQLCSEDILRRREREILDGLPKYVCTDEDEDSRCSRTFVVKEEDSMDAGIILQN